MQPYVNVTAPPIANIGVSSTSTLTTTSGTDTAMTGMSITPVVGTYLAIFSGAVQTNLAGNSVTFSFYVGGVQDTTSIMSVAPFDGGTLSTVSASCCGITQGVYTVSGSQSIAIQWHVSGGTASVFQRKLTLVKIG